jgi:hypothetical protein
VLSANTATLCTVSGMPHCSSTIATFAARRVSRANTQWGAFGHMVSQLVREEVRSLGHDIDVVFKELHVPLEIEGHLVDGVNSTLRLTQHVLASAGARADSFLQASASNDTAASN